MSTHAYAWGWQQDTLGDDSAKFVLMAMCEFADATGLCWPSHGTLARMTGKHRATVIRAIDRLVELGLVARHPGQGRSSTYRLMLERPKFPTESKSSAEYGDHLVAERNERAYPQGVASGATGRHPQGVALCDTHLSHGATGSADGVSHGATGGVAPMQQGVSHSYATRTVMNRNEPSAPHDPDAWHRLSETERQAGKANIERLRRQIEARRSVLPEDWTDPDACEPDGIERPMRLIQGGAS